MKILWVSEFRAHGGGYTAITEGMALGLTKLGHSVKVLGVNYDGFQHPLGNISVIPMLAPELLGMQIKEIANQWFPDIVVVCLDLPHHGDIFDFCAEVPAIRYAGIFPVEGAPFVDDWAWLAGNLDYRFTISRFGQQVAAEKGIVLDYLPITYTPGILTATADGIAKMRRDIKIEGKKVVLKIADNHQRKNWPETIEFFAKWAKPDSVFFAITRMDNQFGWDLRTLLRRAGGIQYPNSTVFRWPNGAEWRMFDYVERKELSWALNVADVLVVDSGNEGACLPIYEAFATRLPVVGMNHTGITELLSDGRGILFESGHRYTDTFGGVHRYYPAYEPWAQALDTALNTDTTEMKDRAQQWVMNRNWVKAAEYFTNRILAVAEKVG